tara:strand:+ start:996 stop:2114 length:1119 start_codon:yes stop_codon:yes gene_type:complete
MGVRDQTLYNELNINSSATQNEIKKAYRQLALKHHPDKGGDDETFKKITAAYEILSDEEKREKYDQFGMDGLNENHVQFQGADIFDMFFGGRRRPNSRQQRKGKDSVYNIRVSLNDLYCGKTFKFAIHRKKIDGPITTCSACRGMGTIRQIRQFGPGFVQEIQRACEVCQGVGNSCKYINEKVETEVEIQPGMTENSQIRLKGKGNEIAGVQTGDVVFTLSVNNHDMFARKGDNLFIKLRVSLIECLAGCSFDITHLDGRILKIKSPEGMVVSPNGGSVLPLKQISEEGMPLLGLPHQKGNLIIAFIITYPPNNYFSEDDAQSLIKLLPEKFNKSVLEDNEENTKILEDVNPNMYESLNDDNTSHLPQCTQM